MWLAGGGLKNERFISCDGHQLYDFKGLGVDLEVEGVHYIDMHGRLAAHVLGSPLSRGEDLELDCESMCPCEYMA